jgi:CBS domain-containing protein
MFPLGALLGARASTSRYRAARDTFCLAVTAAAFDATFRSSTPFSDFCTRRLGHLLDLARAEAQAAYLSDSNATLGLATPLGQMVRGAPVHCRRETPLGEALATMDRRKGRCRSSTIRADRSASSPSTT